MKHLLWLVFLSSTVAAVSQNIPQVPAKIQIADMKLTITEGARKDIQKDVDALRSSDKFFRIKLDRVVLYMPLVERLLKEENIPDDIKYLAIQESAFIPDAVSTSKAVGFWQFKDYTARDMGMRVDNKIDERKNIHASTVGAAKYFKSHQKQLDNWANSINAHMTGATGIKKYISPKDKGARKMTITKKTHWYLKRFIAHKIAFQHELDHKNSKGLELLEYKKGAGKDLAKIAREFKIEEEKLREYNKWLIHGRIPGDKRYVVMVPVQRGNRRARQLAENSDPLRRKKAANLDESKPKAEVVYPKGAVTSFTGERAGVIKINGVKAILASSNDDFESILKRSGLREKKLLKFNDLGSRPQVRPGDIYFIKKKKKKSPIGFYTVPRGESLWDVSQKVGLRLSALLKKNRMSISDIPKPGRVLWLSANRPSSVPVEYQELVEVIEKPVDNSRKKEITQEQPVSIQPEVDKKEEVSPNPEIKPTPTPPTPKPVTKAEKEEKSQTHIVEAGDTFWSISRIYAVTVAEILNWNNMAEGASLSIGQELLIQGDESPKAMVKKEENEKRIDTKIHIVRGGDTFYSIARKYQMQVNDLMKINGLDDTAVLAIGQELKVTASSEKEEKQELPPVEENQPGIHEVKPGESLYGIARKYQLDVKSLLEMNDLDEGTVLSIGQELIISASSSKEEVISESSQSQEEKATFHEVKSGDTLYNIARKYKMTVDELKQLNNKTDNSLSLGEKLKVNQ